MAVLHDASNTRGLNTIEQLQQKLLCKLLKHRVLKGSERFGHHEVQLLLEDEHMFALNPKLPTPQNHVAHAPRTLTVGLLVFFHDSLVLYDRCSFGVTLV